MRGALLFAALVVTAAAVAIASAARPAAASPTAVTALPTLESDVLRLINRFRARHGLRPLRASRLLAAAAEEHSRALARRGLFTHRLPGGPSFDRRIRHHYGSSGYRRWSAGENIAAEMPMMTAREALNLWIASPGHRRNLLGRWREVGLGAVHAVAAPGVWGGADVTIVTADFGARS